MKTALVCVSFGTSVAEARRSIAAVEEALRAELPQARFVRAFTSPTIRRALAARGEEVWSFPQALEHLAQEGYERVVAQPTHLLYGVEYEAIRAQAEEARGRFPRLLLGSPLLAGTQDLQDLAQAVCESCPKQPGQALVLMGHGTPHFSNVVYPALQGVFRAMGRADVFVGTVEGWPGIGLIARQVKEAGFPAARLAPLMLVAGDHARRDMAGDAPESWKNVLARQGLEVSWVLRGLGRTPACRPCTAATCGSCWQRRHSRGAGALHPQRAEAAALRLHHRNLRGPGRRWGRVPAIAGGGAGAPVPDDPQGPGGRGRPGGAPV